MKINSGIDVRANGKSARFHRVAGIDEFVEGRGKRVVIEGVPIAVWKLDEWFYAIADTCSHQEGTLASGKLTGHIVACPRHGAMFDVRTGRVLSLPAVRGVKSYPVKVEEGIVYVSPVPNEETEPDVLRLDKDFSRD